MEFDDILTKHVGAFGLYQLLFYFGVCSVAISMAIGVLEYSFVGATPDHWCTVPDLNTYNFTQAELEKYISPPNTDSGYDACLMYDRDYANVSEYDVWSFLYGNHSNDAVLKTTDCYAWSYDQSEYTSTVVSEVRNQ